MAGDVRRALYDGRRVPGALALGRGAAEPGAFAAGSTGERLEKFTTKARRARRKIISKSVRIQNIAVSNSLLTLCSFRLHDEIFLASPIQPNFRSRYPGPGPGTDTV